MVCIAPTGGLIAYLFALLAPTVCQTDFQDVPAISALNCSNITDFLEAASALFEWNNSTFTCDLMCEMAMVETISPTPTPTSPLCSEAETLPFRMTVSHSAVDCGMSCWSGNQTEPLCTAEGSPEPTLPFLSQAVSSTSPISATPSATEDTSNLLDLTSLYTALQQNLPTTTLAPAAFPSFASDNMPSFSQQSLNSDACFTIPSLVVSSLLVPSVSSLGLTPSNAMMWSSVIGSLQSPYSGAYSATTAKEALVESTSEPTTDSIPQSFSSPCVLQASGEESEETFVIPPQPGTPDSYTIQVTGHPTIVQNFASGSPYSQEWPVFGTTAQAPSVQSILELTLTQELTPTPEPTEITPTPEPTEITPTPEPTEITPTPEPTEVNPSTPVLEQLENAAVVATFADITLQEWEAVEKKFKTAVAEQASQYCSQQIADCKASQKKRRRRRRRESTIQFDSNHVIVLPGYPRVVEHGLEVAYSLLLPALSANTAERTWSLIDAAVLEVITLEGKDDIEQRVGKEIVSLLRFTYTPSTTQSQLQDSDLVGIAVGSFIGCCSGAGAALILFRLRQHIKKWWKRRISRRHRKHKRGTEFTDIVAAPYADSQMEINDTTF